MIKRGGLKLKHQKKRKRLLVEVLFHQVKECKDKPKVAILLTQLFSSL